MSEQEFTVTLVDDDGAVLKAVSRLLRSAGFKVTAFDSPEAFLKAYDPTRFGCVVMDLTMPIVSGLDLQEALRHAALSGIGLSAAAHPPLPAQTAPPENR